MGTKKLPRTIVGFGVLLVIFFVPTHFRLMPGIFPVSWQSTISWIIWVGLINAALAYLISLLFSSRLPLLRSLGTAWLAVAGLTYLVSGVMELDPRNTLVMGVLWDGLISPYFPYSLFSEISMHGTHLDPKRQLIASDPSCWNCMDPHYGFVVIAVVVGVTAIIAVFLMAKSLKAGYWIWLGLLGLSLAGMAAYVIAACLGLGFQAIAVQVCWEVSYILAFVFAWRGADFSKVGPLTSFEEW